MEPPGISGLRLFRNVFFHLLRRSDFYLEGKGHVSAQGEFNYFKLTLQDLIGNLGLGPRSELCKPMGKGKPLSFPSVSMQQNCRGPGRGKEGPGQALGA